MACDLAINANTQEILTGLVAAALRSSPSEAHLMAPFHARTAGTGGVCRADGNPFVRPEG